MCIWLSILITFKNKKLAINGIWINIPFFTYLLIVFRKFSGGMYWVFHKLSMSPSFWLLTIIILPICLIPTCFVAVYDRSRPGKLSYQYEREENLQDTYSEWSVPSTEVIILHYTYSLSLEEDGRFILLLFCIFN